MRPGGGIFQYFMKRTYGHALVVMMLLLICLVWYSWRFVSPSASSPTLSVDARLPQRELLPSDLVRDTQRLPINPETPTLVDGHTEHILAFDAQLMFVSTSTGSPFRGGLLTFTSSSHVAVTARSNNEGLVDLPAGFWRITGWEAPICAISPAEVYLTSGTRRTVSVAECIGLRVEVRDELGQPLEDASVEWQPTFATGPGHAGAPSSARQLFTDRAGDVLFAALPLTWGGRLLVNKKGYYPFQQTLPSASSAEAVTEVTLRATSATKRWGIRCIDIEYRPLSGVLCYADIVSNSWPEVRPVFLGRSGRDGIVPLDDWVDTAYELVFYGSVYPSRHQLQLGDLQETQFLDIVLPRAVRGQFRFTDVAAGEHVQISVTDPTPKQRRSNTTLLPQRYSLLVDSDGLTEGVLPERLLSNVTICDSTGHMSAVLLQVDADGWEESIEFSDGSDLDLVPRGAHISRIVCYGNTIVDGLELAFVEQTDDSVRVRIPPDLRSLKIFAADGRHVMLSRRHSGAEGRVDINFEPARSVLILLKDSNGVPITDVEVALQQLALAKIVSPGGCWAQRVQSGYQGTPDSAGRVQIGVPDGKYNIEINQLAWRGAVVSGWKPFRTSDAEISVTGGLNVFELGVSRPRQIELHLRRFEVQRLPERWTLWSPKTEQGVVFQGAHVEAWITEESQELELRDENGTVFATVNIPAGIEPWRGEVTL